MIKLERITEGSFRAICDMRLSEAQNRFVAPNVVSLAQAWLYYDDARPFAICEGDTVVGFMMLDWDPDERSVGIWRFMIAPDQQGKGYGRAAMVEAINMVKATGLFDYMHLDYVPGNEVARNLYFSLGFRENGKIEEGEVIMILPLTDNPHVGMLTADMDDWDDFTQLIALEDETVIPQSMKEEALKKAILDKKAKRFTLMGETIGIAIKDDFLVSKDRISYLGEIKEMAKQKDLQ